MTYADSHRPSAHFDIGRVAGRTFAPLRRNLVVFGLLTLALSGAPELAVNSLQLLTTQAGGAGAGLQTGLFLSILAGAVVYVLSAFALQAAVVHGVIVDLSGGKPRFADCLTTGLRYLAPLLGLTVLVAVVFVAGLFATFLLVGIVPLFGILFVPVYLVLSVIVLLSWIVTVPVVVAERTSLSAAFARSAKLTRNHRGAIFGLVLAYFVLAIVVLLPTLAAAEAMRSSGGPAGAGTGIVVSAAVQAISQLISAAGIASIYYELRSIREGVGPEALAAVFD